MTLGTALASSDRPLQVQYDAVLLDLDGVVYVGPDAVPGAADALNGAQQAGATLAYLTNNASRTAATVASHLRELGMPVPGEQSVVTSAQAVAHLMARQLPHQARVLVIGGEGLRTAMRDHELIPVSSLDDDPVAVVQGYDPTIGWLDLAEAAYAVQRGLPWYASNTDLTIPTPRGIAPGNGSLVNTVRTATGQDPVIAGKPSRPLFDETFERIAATRPLMVGDRLDTDIDGAITAEIDSLAVLTGVSSLADFCAAAPGHRPSFVADDLSALDQSHSPVDIDGDQATCGSSRVVVRDGRIELDHGAPRDVSTLRATVQLAWSHFDTSHTQLVPGGTLEP